MKYFVKLFVITSMLFVYTNVSAEQKIVYMDLNLILNNSKAGKEAQDFLKNSFQNNQKKFTNTEKALKKEENDLLEKKDLVDVEVYKAKVDDLRKKVMEYQSKRRETLDKISKLRRESREKLIKKIDPIVSTYIKENNISFVLNKKVVLGAQTGLDITEIIINKLNKDLPSLNLK